MSGARAHANKEEINEQHKENERKIAAARFLSCTRPENQELILETPERI